MMPAAPDLREVGSRIVEIFGPDLLRQIARLDESDVAGLAGEVRATANRDTSHRMGRLLVLFGESESDLLEARAGRLKRTIASLSDQIEARAEAFVRNELLAAAGPHAGKPLSPPGRKRRMSELLDLAAKRERLRLDREAAQRRIKQIRDEEHDRWLAEREARSHENPDPGESA